MVRAPADAQQRADAVLRPLLNQAARFSCDIWFALQMLFAQLSILSLFWRVLGPLRPPAIRDDILVFRFNEHRHRLRRDSSDGGLKASSCKRE